MFDLKIIGGTVVDGTGAERYRADIGIKDGKIVDVVRRGRRPRRRAASTGEAAETIDATGKVVAPGFVDIHTHYDGQVSWDGLLEPSSGHGVTTVVTGNCGVGFAPVRPGTEDWLIELMEGVEDIPGTALTEGMTWGWETYPEYLDAIGKQKFSIDVGSQVAHGAIRAYAMGERGARNEPATPEDIAAMARLVTEADRGRRARILDLAHDGPPRDGRRAGARHLRRRGRAVRSGPRHGGRRSGGVRAGAPGCRGRGHRRPEEGTGLDAAVERRDRPAGVVRADPGGRRPEPVARACWTSRRPHTRRAAGCTRRSRRARSA